MASAQSLLGLVNQLQDMEMSFVAILMEAAMKLSALTDANIFVLVETQEGRRFSGKRHLCDAYLAGGMTPTGNDVEFEINPSVTSLQQRRLPFVGQSVNNHEVNNQNSKTPPTRQNASPILTNVQSLLDARSPIPSGAASNNRKRSLPPPDSQTKQQRLSLGSISNEETTVKEEVKTEIPDNQAHSFQDNKDSISSEVVALIVPDSDDDSDIAEIIDALPGGHNTKTLHNTSAIMETSLSQGISAFDDHQISSTFDLPFSYPASFEKKLQALNSMNSDSLFDKISMEHRLFSSCIYQFGSLLAKHAVSIYTEARDLKHPQMEEYFNMQVELWVSKFPYLVAADARGVRVNDSGVHGLTVSGFIRHRARNAFRKGLNAFWQRKSLNDF